MVMTNKTTLLVIALFLAFLFVVSFQPIITGNVVYSWDNVDLSNYPFPFIKNNYYNDVYIVVGNGHNADEMFAAYDVAYGLQGLRSKLPAIIVENEIPANAHNLILVGTPCTNTLIAEFLETNDCDSIADNGIVSLSYNDRKARMVVSGRTSQDVRKAALFLRNYPLYAPKGNVALIEGSISNPNGFVVTYPN